MDIELSQKYEPLFDPEVLQTVHTFIITGGRFSAKSFAVSLASCHWANDLGHRIIYTRYTNVSGKDSIIPEFEEKLSLLNYENNFDVNQGRITHVDNGSKIIFKGLKTGSNNQTAALKSIKDFSVWVLEEAEELEDEKTYDKVALSVRGNGPISQYNNLKVLILNPTTKEHFIYKRYFEEAGVPDGFNGIKNGVCYIHTSYQDCIKHVPEEIVSEFERMRLTNPQKYNNVVLGGWLDRAEGVIFDNWKIGEFDHSIGFGFGQDYGFSTDPTTLVKIAIDEKRKLLYVDEKLYKTDIKTPELVKINRFNCGNHVIVGDSSEARLLSELKSNGLNIRPAYKPKGSVSVGIQKLKEYTIIVTPTSTNYIKELNNYAWLDSKSNTPIDKWNHCVDATRYYVDYVHRKAYKPSATAR